MIEICFMVTLFACFVVFAAVRVGSCAERAAHDHEKEKQP